MASSSSNPSAHTCRWASNSGIRRAMWGDEASEQSRVVTKHPASTQAVWHQAASPWWPAYCSPLSVFVDVNSAAGLPPVPWRAADQAQLDARGQVWHALDVYVAAAPKAGGAWAARRVCGALRLWLSAVATKTLVQHKPASSPTAVRCRKLGQRRSLTRQVRAAALQTSTLQPASRHPTYGCSPACCCSTCAGSPPDSARPRST